MTKAGKAALALAAVVVVAVAAVGGGSAAPQKTLTIGWAYDGVGNMAPFDGPALATAKSHIASINKASTTKVRLITCNTQGNKPAIAKACARKLLSQGADVIMTTCDVDYAAPVVQESINAGKLTVAACIGTDQMGP
jgi:ABC-type branched-subunit amino acid transport system substrate-binding protein